MYKFADDLPGPEGLPILGVATEFNSLNREGGKFKIYKNNK